MSIKNINSRGVLIPPKSTTKIGFQEYMFSYILKEIQLHEKFTAIEGGGFRDCPALTTLTIHTTFKYMGSQAFASSPLQHLHVIHEGKSYDFDFPVRITGNDVMSIINSVVSQKPQGSFSATVVKYYVLLNLFFEFPSEENTKAVKKSTFSIAMALINAKDTEMFRKLIAHTELFSEKQIASLKDHAKNKKNIAEIKKLLDDFQFSVQEESAPVKPPRKKRTSSKIDVSEILTIEKGRLKAVTNGDYKEIIIPDSVKSINKGVFDVVKIKKLVLPPTLKKITQQNFKGAVNLSEIIISDGTAEIGKEAFRECKNLKKITIPPSVKTIGDMAFKNCTKLAEIALADGIESIGKEAFSGCKALKKIRIPASVAELGHAVFTDCIKLESAVLNTSSVGYGGWSTAFMNCKSLKSLSSENNALHITDNIIYNENMTEILFIPDGAEILVLPETIEEAVITGKVKELTFYQKQKIQFRTETLQKITMIAGDKIYSLDVPSKTELFEFSQDYMGLRHSSHAFSDMFDDIVTALQTGEISDSYFHKLGEVAWLDYEGCGPVHISSLFPLRFRLAEILHDLYQKDILEIGREQVSAVADNYAEGEDAKELQQVVLEFFPFAPQYLPCLDKYPVLLILAAEDAVKLGTVSVLKSLQNYPDLLIPCINLFIQFGTPKKIQKILDEYPQYFNQNTIDEFIRTAIDRQKHEIQILLTNYKNQNIGFADPAEKLKL